MKTVYDFTVKDRMGNDVSLSEYRDRQHRDGLRLHAPL